MHGAIVPHFTRSLQGKRMRRLVPVSRMLAAAVAVASLAAAVAGSGAMGLGVPPVVRSVDIRWNWRSACSYA